MTYPAVSPDVRKELEGTPELAEIERREREIADDRYPQPEVHEITALYQELRPRFAKFHDAIRAERERRYHQDTLPDKWQLNLEDGRRFYSNLTGNEIYRVTAAQCRNSPQWRILPAGKTEKARNASAKETRWVQNCWSALERQAADDGGLRWRWCDAQNEAGIAAYEFYLTRTYDKLKSELKQKTDESDDDYNDRTDRLLMSAGLPFGLRVIDPLSLYFDRDADGICAALIVERKPYKPLYRRLRAKHGKAYMDGTGLLSDRTPDPGDPGRPVSQHRGAQSGITNDCETIRYYDHRWYAYLVDGVCVEGPVEHGLPGLPLFVGYGMTTSSPNLDEMARGICMGMHGMEIAVNDAMTLALDVAYTYSRPRWGILTPNEGQLMGPEDGLKDGAIELKPDMAVQFRPGQTIENLMKGVNPADQTRLVPQIMQFYQRSGQNPIAQGESPGSDPAGYTVNALTNAAQAQYERNLDNEGILLGRVMDFARKTVRDTIGDRVGVAAPMDDERKGGVEWLWLDPEDVSETPSIVTIDPLSDANRIAMAQHWRQGNKEGYVPRSEVQKRGYGAEDTQAWDREIILDVAKQQLASLLVELAKNQAISAEAPPQQPQLVGPQGEPIGTANGAIPAPPQPPTVGAPQAGASQFSQPGPAALNGQTARAGQGPQGGGGPL